MDLGQVVNIVLAASTVAVAVMAGLSYGSRKALREANEDLRKRIDDLEKDRDRCREEINTVRAAGESAISELRAKADADIAELRSTNEVLARTVTGEVHWKALAESLDGFVRDAHRHWKSEQDMLDDLVGHVDRFIKSRGPAQ